MCISVCKNWKSLITNQSFNQQLANNSNNNYLFLQFSSTQQISFSHWAPRSWYEKVIFSIYSDDDQSVDHLSVSKLALCFDQTFSNNFIVIGPCNGLVCLSDCYFSSPPSTATFILTNPFIKKYVVLPKSTTGPLESSDHGECMSGFGFDSNNNDFIVVNVFLYYWKSTPSVEVYSLKTGKWRSSIVGIGLSLCISEHEIIGNRVFVNEALRWLICANQFGRGHNNVILLFDLATNTLKELILPVFGFSTIYRAISFERRQFTCFGSHGLVHI